MLYFPGSSRISKIFCGLFSGIFPDFSGSFWFFWVWSFFCARFRAQKKPQTKKKQTEPEKSGKKPEKCPQKILGIRGNPGKYSKNAINRPLMPIHCGLLPHNCTLPTLARRGESDAGQQRSLGKAVPTGAFRELPSGPRRVRKSSCELPGIAWGCPRLGKNKTHKHKLFWKISKIWENVRGGFREFSGLPGPRGGRKRILREK